MSSIGAIANKRLPETFAERKKMADEPLQERNEDVVTAS
jgi:hypothetical protein